MSVEYYHTSDPLENFQLRLVVREFSRSNIYKPAIIKGVSDEGAAAEEERERERGRGEGEGGDEAAQPLLAERSASSTSNRPKPPASAHVPKPT